MTAQRHRSEFSELSSFPLSSDQLLGLQLASTLQHLWRWRWRWPEYTEGGRNATYVYTYMYVCVCVCAHKLLHTKQTL